VGIVALRQARPRRGPTFGIKGGGAAGPAATHSLVPMETFQSAPDRRHSRRHRREYTNWRRMIDNKLMARQRPEYRQRPDIYHVEAASST